MNCTNNECSIKEDCKWWDCDSADTTLLHGSGDEDCQYFEGLACEGGCKL